MPNIDPLKILADLDKDGASIKDADLTDAAAQLREAFDAATTADEPDLELAKSLREGLDKINVAITEREKAAEARKAELAELRKGIFDDEAAKEEAEEVVAEAEEVAAEAAAEEKVPVAASSASIIERLTAFAKQKAPEVKPVKTTPDTRIRAVGAAASYELGDGGFQDLGGMFSTHAKSITAPGKSESLFRFERHFDDTRKLGYNTDANNRKMLEVFGAGPTARSPLAASGGLCGPGDVDHTSPICSLQGRPVRDNLTQFLASRGKLTFMPSMSVGDLSDNVSIWSMETDESPGDQVKPCPPLACPEELSCETDAVVRCITVGNFQAQFSPEWWASALETLMAEFDRVAEQKSIEEIHAASADQGTVDEGNVLASFLIGLQQIVSASRSAQRNWDVPYTVIADAYLRDYVRAQTIANLGVANNVDALMIADATINGWVQDITGGGSVVWTYDGTFNEAAGEHRVLEPGERPTDAGVYVFPQDAFVFLDGGTLDLGTSISDSVLNATNDRQAFAESFEKTCFRGCDAYRFDLGIDLTCGCPA